MTTKPRAKIFRVRRTGSLAGAPPKPGAGTPHPSPAKSGSGPAADDDGFGSKPFPTARAAVEGTSQSTEIEEIKKEGLTGRQLRMARRLAQKQGLAPISDYDAVRLLRAKGVDPFQRTTMLELVAPGPAAEPPAQTLPQTVPPTPAVRDEPAAGTPVAYDPQVARAQEIREIQQDIARRRRRKLRMLFVRLFAFVGLPTLVAGYYYYAVATPMYATKSEFIIQQADAPAAGLGGLFSGTGLATSQDSIVVQSYLQSRDAMLRLDRDIGFKAHFSQPDIDLLQRLDADATNEAAYKVFKKRVKIGYDPTEGNVRMEVSAADPAVSAAFSKALIRYAEEQVDDLTQRLREDQMAGARQSFEDAETKMETAQARVLSLQEQLGVLDPVSESSAVMSQVTTFEVQLAEKQLQLEQLLDNARPNQARVDGVRGDIDRLRNLIDSLRAQLTQGNSDSGSLAQVTSQLRMAEVDLETRTMMMQESLQQLESARIEANRQVRYLSTGVSPVAPDEPTYPRKFENTMLAFLIFSGIYLMASLTASILREQVSG